jgi:hypothetical protein
LLVVVVFSVVIEVFGARLLSILEGGFSCFHLLC